MLFGSCYACQSVTVFYCCRCGSGLRCCVHLLILIVSVRIRERAAATSRFALPPSSNSPAREPLRF
ncbi:hypothetical protein [Methanimicrococcus hongohii]|uniref:hypothetical protein n=1 Tax=Methanimicrococcus hongohii TaxID=3028295 RepID=UPI00292F0F63|nr:hypothetical protein [Methanimicrococcus sp. Hf6]